jgi:hypothetical protein
MTTPRLPEVAQLGETIVWEDAPPSGLRLRRIDKIAIPFTALWARRSLVGVLSDCGILSVRRWWFSEKTDPCHFAWIMRCHHARRSPGAAHLEAFVNDVRLVHWGVVETTRAAHNHRSTARHFTERTIVNFCNGARLATNELVA